MTFCVRTYDGFRMSEAAIAESIEDVHPDYRTAVAMIDACGNYELPGIGYKTRIAGGDGHAHMYVVYTGCRRRHG